MKLKINKTVVLGVLPGSNPPEMVWHEFKLLDHSVEHYIEGKLRAEIANENFGEYVSTQNNFDLRVEVDDVVITETENMDDLQTRVANQLKRRAELDAKRDALAAEYEAEYGRPFEG